jgi:hypothetical protein
MHSEASKRNTRYGWLKAIGVGLILIAVGLLRLLGGVQVVTHWTGQPMFSWGLIAGGIVCILSAFIPNFTRSMRQNAFCKGTTAAFFVWSWVLVATARLTT